MQAMVTATQGDQVVSTMLVSLGNGTAVIAGSYTGPAGPDQSMQLPFIKATPDFIDHFDIRYAQDAAIQWQPGARLAGYMGFKVPPSAMTTGADRAGRYLATLGVADAQGAWPASSPTWTMELLDDPATAQRIPCGNIR